MTLAIGIDPGRYGCIWLWADAASARLFLDTRSMLTVVDAATRIKDRLCGHRGSNIVAVERNHSMPGMPHHAAFTFGASYGGLLAALAAREVAHEVVAAASWRKWALGKVPKDRKGRDTATIAAAKARWPDWEWPKARKWQEAQAAAMFIGAYAAHKYLKEEV